MPENDTIPALQALIVQAQKMEQELKRLRVDGKLDIGDTAAAESRLESFRDDIEVIISDLKKK
jgi:hypothetical protein